MIFFDNNMLKFWYFESYSARMKLSWEKRNIPRESARRALQTGIYPIQNWDSHLGRFPRSHLEVTFNFWSLVWKVIVGTYKCQNIRIICQCRCEKIRDTTGSSSANLLNIRSFFGAFLDLFVQLIFLSKLGQVYVLYTIR